MRGHRISQVWQSSVPLAHKYGAKIETLGILLVAVDTVVVSSQVATNLAILDSEPREFFYIITGLAPCRVLNYPVCM